MDANQRNEWRREGLRALENLGIPIDYLLELVDCCTDSARAFMAGEMKLTLPRFRPFESQKLIAAWQRYRKGRFAERGIPFDHFPVEGTGGRVDFPDASFICDHGLTEAQNNVLDLKRKAGATEQELQALRNWWRQMVPVGPVMGGLRFECVECGRTRVKPATKKQLGMAHGTHVRTVRQEIRARCIAAVAVLCPKGNPWPHLAKLLETEGCPLTSPGEDDTDTLAREARRYRQIFSPAEIEEIKREARIWSLPIE